MKNIVLSLVFLFVVSLGVQAQSTPQKKDKPATTTTTTEKSKTQKAKTEKKSTKKSCTDAKEKGCDAEAEAGCADKK